MSIIKPFNAVRYEQKNLNSLICPPYDVISDAEKEKLISSNENNMVKLELPDASENKNKYMQAKNFFSEWQKQGVLKTDSKPAYYFYEQTFKDHGVKMVRRGFFSALKLENPHEGSIKPHERTLAKPKEDRLKLIRAVQANLSPIFGLFNDKNNKVINFCEKISAEPCISQAKDKEGTIHKLWIVEDEKNIKWITQAIASQKIFIADGHHRYETAWNYLQERKAKDKKYSEESEYNYVMIFLCPMEDKGLSIWPTHRIVEAPADFEKRVAEYFDILPSTEFKKLSNESPQPLLVYVNGKYRTLKVKNSKILSKIMPDKCKAYRELGVSILHSLLLSDVAPDKITYVKDEKEACKLAKERGCMAVMVPSTPIKAIKEIALANQTMPQKSTYFYPKVGSGMLIHSL